MISVSPSHDGNHSDIIAFLIQTLAPYSDASAADWSETTALESTGIDSFDFVEIIFKIEDEYKVDIEFNANLNFAQIKTIGDLAMCIEAVLERKIAA